MPAVELTQAQPLALPVVDGTPCERADAARNRALILKAAEKLIAEHGVEHVSMDAIAVEAGVGKGTLFRRFGGRAGLLHSLIDERERAFQEELIRGAPPLGPGAPAVERLVAFGRRQLEHLEEHGDLVLAAESGGGWARFEHPVYVFHRAHVAALVREAGGDPDYLTDVLMAPLSAELALFQRRVRGLPLAQLADGYEQLVGRLFGV